MDTLTTNREQLIESIKALPEASLIELTYFMDYLRYKATEKQAQQLADEVNPIRGWSVHPDEQV